jgi:hypothetical protein
VQRSSAATAEGGKAIKYSLIECLADSKRFIDVSEVNSRRPGVHGNVGSFYFANQLKGREYLQAARTDIAVAAQRQ